MKVTLTLKELLVMLDVIIFAHVRFHRGEFSALLGTEEESREEIRKKILNTIIDILSDNKETEEIELTETDLINLLGYITHFEFYDEYEEQNRFKWEDVKNLKDHLEKLRTDKMIYRQLSSYEVQVLDKLLENKFSGRDELVNQIKRANVRSLTDYKDNDWRIEFQDSDEESWADVKENIPVEGKTIDQDGGEVLIILHVKNGRAKELEFIRKDGQPILRLPDVDKMEVRVK